ncbi:MAG: hypothetical protein KDE14_02580, partial [Rhodobacteraceae bacterium]|nr:hypothetical protein [Paracoccaceae bacterium]
SIPAARGSSGVSSTTKVCAGTDSDLGRHRVNTINALLGGPFGDLILKPWYDPVALAGVVHAYLPLSRAWAAASGTNGDPDLFSHYLGQDRPMTAALAKAIGEVARRKAAYDAADTAFGDAIFGSPEFSGEEIAGLYAARTVAADTWMKGRATFLPGHVVKPFPSVRFNIEGPDAVERRHGHRIGNLSSAFAIDPQAVRVDISRERPDAVYHTKWLRMSHGSEEPSWARLDQTADGKAMGTVVFCHGVLMEREFFYDLYDQTAVFLAPEIGAINVIQPEGPWHSRRMLPGHYGGEPLLGNPVGGMLDYFETHVREIGRLIAWVRRTIGGPVAVGGVSLGALTAQLVLSAAKDWPEEARPDAGILLTTNESVLDVAYNSSLASSLKFPEMLPGAGWTHDLLSRWTPLMEPGEPAVAPERIVCLLGTTDTVTPIGGGERLVQRWHLPEDNVFRWVGGHFAAAFSVLRDPTPVHRFKRIVAGL